MIQIQYVCLCVLSFALQVVVQEMRQVVANPQIQGQIIDYAKQACSVFPSFQATCVADVDQYAPMAFGMILAYLQPEQVSTAEQPGGDVSGVGVARS
jgi:hypothetical protein